MEKKNVAAESPEPPKPSRAPHKTRIDGKPGVSGKKEPLQLE
jgi:hypothetical protein